MHEYTLHKRIITLLKEGKYTISDMAFILGSPECSVRGRLSELRKMGYSVSKKYNKYFLEKTSIDKDRFDDTLKKLNMLRRPISINILAKVLNVKREEVEE